MGLIAPSVPTIGDPNTTEDVDVRNALVALLALVNGNLDAANIANASLGIGELDAAFTAALAQLGLNDGTTVRRAASIIAGEHSTNSAAYTKLGATPGTDRDQVTVTVPLKGKLRISFLGAWKCSASATIKAAIFIGATQLKLAARGLADIDVATVDEASQVVSGADDSTSVIGSGRYAQLATGLARGFNTWPNAAGLASSSDQGFSDPAFAAFPTTGLIVPAIEVPIAAGTYDVSVQFKTTAGNLSVKDRRLFVEAIGF